MSYIERSLGEGEKVVIRARFHWLYNLRAWLAIVVPLVLLIAVMIYADEMVREGRELSRIAKNVIIKIPMLKEGLKAIKTLSSEGIKINTTLIFSASQALLAAKAGASYVSPFIGRLDDISHVGMDIIRDIRIIFDNYDYPCEILAASIRHPLHFVDAAKAGADVATIPFSVLEALTKHPLTDLGLQKFLKDWESVPQPARKG